MKIQCLTALLAAAVMLLMTASCGGSTSETPFPEEKSDVFTYEQNTAISGSDVPYEGYELAARSGGMSLFVDPATTRFVLEDGQGGVWYSGVSEDAADEDEIAYGEYRRAMTSLLSVYACDENAESAKEYASTRHSVEEDTFTLRYVHDAAGEQIGFRADFTFEDLWTTIPVEITLRDGALKATILTDEIVIEEPETTVLTEMSLLPYFGCASAADEGYMLVPDGCGGIIRYNNGTVAAGTFEVSLYGDDAAFVKKRTNGNEEKTLLPVFGMKTGNHAFMAVISGCDAYANILAEVAGIHSEYNNVYTRFRFKQTDSFPLKDQGGTAQDYTVIDVHQRDLPDAAVEYRFLAGDRADYNGMADTYAEYLTATEGMKVTKTDADYVLELFGAVKKKKAVAGIPAVVSEQLTTFRQAREMLATLTEQAPDAVPVIRYRYATGSQLKTSVSERADISRLLGGYAGYEALCDDVAEHGGRVYLTVSSAVTKESMFGSGYIRNVMNLKAYQYRYDPLTGYQTAGSKTSLYMPDIVYDKMTSLFARAAKDPVCASLAPETVAGEVYTSFGKTYFSRETTKAYWRALLGQGKEQGISLMLDSAAAFSLPYADMAVDVPTQSNHYSMVDEDIPFYQLVFARFLPCVSQPLNLTSNPRLAFLRCLQSGSVPQFAFVAEDPSVLLDTELEWLFAADFDKWAEDAAQMIRQWQTVRAAAEDTPVTACRTVGDKVTATVFGNGAVLLVNTDGADHTVDGTPVPAMGWVLQS